MRLEYTVILSQIIAFLLMLWILKALAWKPFFKLQAERKGRIEAEFSAIERGKAEVDRLSEEYREKLRHIDEEAEKRMEESKLQAEEIASQMIASAQLQAKKRIEDAQKSIAQEITSAHQQLKKRMVDLVIGATEKLIEEKVEEEEMDRKKVAEFIDRFEFTP